MTFIGWIQIVLYCAIVVGITPVLGAYMTRVFMGERTVLSAVLHPVEVAGQAAALDLASNGRAFLGLAAGAWLDRLGLERQRPLTAIRETWEIVRRLLAGDRSGFRGELFSLAPGNGLAYEPLRPAVERNECGSIRRVSLSAATGDGLELLRLALVEAAEGRKAAAGGDGRTDAQAGPAAPMRADDPPASPDDVRFGAPR